MLEIIIGRHTWGGQIGTHIYTKIHTHKKLKKLKKGEWVGKKEKKEERKKRNRGGPEKKGGRGDGF